jgi:nitroimidazol reductase NimA-like FMN-containing flavoprotein (pyridoxamine 5'-phosphate oxidase superfamily)
MTASVSEIGKATREEAALAILGDHRTMAISTVRPDGWPQTTIVGYANEGWAIYFMIFRSSQKFSNIAGDDRASVAISGETNYLGDIKAIYAGAHASEVTDPSERERAWTLLLERHPNLADFGPPDLTDAALMRAICKYVSVVDYSKGIGHTEALTVAGEAKSRA